jgi:acyl carrier protein
MNKNSTTPSPLQLQEDRIHWIVGVLKDLNPEVESIDTNQNLFDSGVLDSLSMIEIVTRLESEFKLSFDYSDFSADNFKDISSIAKMLCEKYAAASCCLTHRPSSD